MKISLSKQALVKGVNIVSKAVPTQTTMAILQCILIDASEDSINLIANDMELGIETIVEGTIFERGIIALDAKIFSELVRKLPDNEVTIETDSSLKTILTCGETTFNLVGKPGDDFSYIPKVARNVPVVISQLTLRDIIRQTIFATSTNENNKTLTGELFEIKSNCLTVTALDGFRVAIRKVELKYETDDNKVIIPGKSLKEIVKIIDGGIDDLVNIFITPNHVIFEFDNTTVVTRTIEGEFIDVNRLIGDNNSIKVTIDKKKLSECIDRTTLLVKEGDKKPIIVDINDKYMEINITSYIGRMDEKIEILKEGNDIKIGFNPKLLLDALRVIDEDSIEIFMDTASKPCYITDASDTFRYIVLPVNFTA